MIILCPACGLQHVDAPEELPMPVPGSAFEGSAGWVDPPHRSHLCRPQDGGCGHIWRPADVATTGVAKIETIGKADHPIPPRLQQPLQPRVREWVLACFGEVIADDQVERRQRFLEEALELVQAAGAPRSEIVKLMDYVYSRPVGELPQEIGGTMTTLAAFCSAHNLDMHLCGEFELARIWTKVEAIRKKQATKPKNSPLPQTNERVPEMFDVDTWHGKLGSAIRNYGEAIEPGHPNPESDELLELTNTLIRQARNAIENLQMALSVSGMETEAYHAGENAAFAGVTERWEQALKDPIPKTGVMNDPLESLYRRTEDLRRKLELANEFILGCSESAGGMLNGNRLSGLALKVLTKTSLKP